MTARRAVVVALVIAAWMYGAWLTRDVDSDRPTSLPLPGKEGASWSAAVVSPPSPSPRTTRASRSHRHLPAVLLRIRECESGGDYRAENPRSTASGAWQILDGTWHRYGGYRHASHAPRDLQDAKALALYADRGTSPWNASRRCWA